MKNDHVPIKEDFRKLKLLQKKLDRLRSNIQSRFDNLLRLKIARSSRAGHIRGGHSFH